MEVFQNQAWSREARFSSFWAHYNAVEKWRVDHARMASVSCRLACGKKKKKNRRKPQVNGIAGPAQAPRRQQVKNTVKERIRVEKNPVSSVNYEEPVAMETEDLSEEMVAFFKKTIEHRKQREADRVEKEQRIRKERGEDQSHWIELDDDEYILADKIGVLGVGRRTFAAPDEEAKTKLRRENARQMYGASAERILAMETLIDMRFEQEYARKRPPLWPNIPLRL